MTLAYLSSLLIASAHADGGQAASPVAATATTAAAQQPNPLLSFLPFIAIFFIFYFLMIRPQKKRMQQEQKMLDALQRGDEVYTKSGVIGTISGLSDKLVTLEVADGVRVKFIRGQIAGKTSGLFTETAKK